MSCRNCYWCRPAMDGEYLWKCKLQPDKRFDVPSFHGWKCKKQSDLIEGRKSHGQNNAESHTQVP